MKKFGIAGMSLLLIASLASCGKDKGTQAATDTTEEETEAIDEETIAAEGVLTDLRVKSYLDDNIITVSDTEKDTSETDAVAIDLSSVAKGTYTGYEVSKKKNITITAAGVYVLSGTLEASLSVNAFEGDVRIILNNATISVPEKDSDSKPVSNSPITFKGNDDITIGKRIITVKEGTTNTLSDSVSDTSANEGDEAVIVAKKNASVTINGTGKLVLNCNGENSSGIKLKEKLTVYGTDIYITAKKNGIKANKTILLYNADIKVNSKGDGIKTDMEASSQEEAVLYSSDYSYGYMYINNSNLTIIAGDDGLVANNCMYIQNGDDNTINITTNGGAPTTVTEKSSDAADGKAIKVAGITQVIGTTETDISATYDKNYCLVLDGGNYEINANSDAIASKGHTIINNGNIKISSGDDAIHSDYITRINNGTINILKSYEGIEGARIEIVGGNTSVVATDDGINAANPDLKNYNISLYIRSGNIYVNAEGDGVDSNGTFTMIGGKLVVDGPSASMNGALDSDNGILLNGGNVVAIGNNSMVEEPGTNSNNCFVVMYLDDNQAANTNIKVLDSYRNELFSMTSKKKFQAVTISLDSFEIGSTYTIVIGDKEYTANIKSKSTIIGTRTGMGGGPGGFGGGPGGPGR